VTTLQIERVEVEEGFLDGLDLRLSPGLNVLIGARGTGKTSIIELIRFSLGIPAFTNFVNETAQRHALSVLGTGRVTVTLVEGSDMIRVSRAADDPKPRLEGPSDYRRPLILSQNEIESIGVDPAGRLRLIDQFRGLRPRSAAQEAALRSNITAVSADLQSLAAEIDRVRSQIEKLANAEEELAQAELEEQSMLQRVEATRDLREQLDDLAAEVSRLSVTSEVVERAGSDLLQWKQRIVQVTRSRPVMEPWPKSAGEADQLSFLRDALSDVDRLLTEVIGRLNGVSSDLQALKDQTQAARAASDDRARQLRKGLNAIEQGAGAVAKRVADLRATVGQLSALRDLLKTQSAQLENLLQTRRVHLDELDEYREQRYAERESIVSRLNDDLGPVVRVSVERFGIQSEYAAEIAKALRGSQLHYNTLAPLLAKHLSPRTLVEAVERGDVSLLAEEVGLPEDRAQRAINWIASHGTAAILTASLEDAVHIELLDGLDYKRTEKLSVGQRCTAILPLLLWHEDDPLIVDQPEDNLDNAFVVDTVIRAIRQRGAVGQLIFATHNANIPVLGEASMVFHLGSDGERAYVLNRGHLDEPSIVEAITNVMEGGKEAFEKRAAFYFGESYRA